MGISLAFLLTQRWLLYFLATTRAPHYISFLQVACEVTEGAHSNTQNQSGFLLIDHCYSNTLFCLWNN